MVTGMVVAGFGFRAAVATGKEAAHKGTPQGSEAADRTDLEASAVRILGVVEGKPIDSGFIFIDGRYVEAPYTVSRRGRQLFINDILIYQWAEWPLMDRHVREDPGPPPKEYEKLTSFAEIITGNPEDVLNSHLDRKRRYLFEHFPKEEAKEKMMEYYRQCPFVASARFVPEWGHVKITTKSGEKENMNPWAPPPHTVLHWDFGAQDVLRGLESLRNSYTGSLSRNTSLFFFGAPFNEYCTQIRPSGFYPAFWKHPGDLKLMVEVLASARSEAEKIEILGRMDFLPSPNCAPREKKNYETLIRHFQPSAQLDERIAALIKQTGVTPRTVKDLPDEIPWDKTMRLAKEKREREQQDKERQEKQ